MDTLPVAIAAVVASRATGRRMQAGSASLGLYQDWLPFLLAVGFVVLEHGVLGVLDPMAMYDHADAWAEPWKWALIHGTFVRSVVPSPNPCT